MEFLNNNPREVILLILQLNGADGADGSSYLNGIYNVLDSVNGFTSRMYPHYYPDAWPTLRTLIDTDQRILLFHFNGPRCQQVQCPPGFIDYFFFAEETEFSFDEVRDLDNVSRSCNTTRGYGGTLDFYAVNNFLSIPSRDSAVELNNRSAVVRRLQECSAFNSKNPDVNVFNIDFWYVYACKLESNNLSFSTKTSISVFCEQEQWRCCLSCARQ
jgi:hypothetical protein